MSARLWPAKQSILPILPATPLTIRLNLDCHKLNHPTRKHLLRNPSDDDSTAKKPVQEQVLSRRKDHTVPTRWSLYRPLIRNAQKVDRILADTAVGEWVSESIHASERTRKPSRVLTRHIQCQWRRKQDLQGYKRVRIWLSVEYKLLEELQRAVQGDKATLEELEERIRAATESAKARKTRRKQKPSLLRSTPPTVQPSFLAPSLFNIALPRMKPQPLSLSMMIDDRVKRRDRRRENQERHRQWAQDMVIEERFWRDVGLGQSYEGPTDKALGQQARSARRGKTSSDKGDMSFTERHYRHVDLIATYFERDAARASTTYTSDMINAVKDARTVREQRRQRRAAARKNVIVTP